MASLGHNELDIMDADDIVAHRARASVARAHWVLVSKWHISTLSSLVAPIVVITTTYDATGDDKVVKLMMFLFSDKILLCTTQQPLCQFELMKAPHILHMRASYGEKFGENICFNCIRDIG